MTATARSQPVARYGCDQPVWKMYRKLFVGIVLPYIHSAKKVFLRLLETHERLKPAGSRYSDAEAVWYRWLSLGGCLPGILIVAPRIDHLQASKAVVFADRTVNWQ